MGGGLMQLVAYGAQDIYLTGNPQITFFKVVYRRHTNFSMELIEQTLNGTGAAGALPETSAYQSLKPVPVRSAGPASRCSTSTAST